VPPACGPGCSVCAHSAHKTRSHARSCECRDNSIRLKPRLVCSYLQSIQSAKQLPIVFQAFSTLPCGSLLGPAVHYPLISRLSGPLWIGSVVLSRMIDRTPTLIRAHRGEIFPLEAPSRPDGTSALCLDVTRFAVTICRRTNRLNHAYFFRMTERSKWPRPRRLWNGIFLLADVGSIARTGHSRYHFASFSPKLLKSSSGEK
jgi:hypothetical protein